MILKSGSRASQFGGALIYILIAIALLAALTTTFTQKGGQSTQTQNTFKLATEINSQSRIIRSGIQDCVLRFPQGDSDITETGYIAPYPLNPTSTEFSSPASTDAVSLIACPGTSSAASSVDDHQAVFGGSLASFLPTQPDLMEPWTYFNGNATGGSQIQGMSFSGVFYQIQSDKSDPFIAEAFTKVDELHSACEVDYTVGTGSNGCSSGVQCLRFWIIRRSGGPTGDSSPNPCP